MIDEPHHRRYTFLQFLHFNETTTPIVVRIPPNDTVPLVPIFSLFDVSGNRIGTVKTSMTFQSFRKETNRCGADECEDKRMSTKSELIVITENNL